MISYLRWVVLLTLVYLALTSNLEWVNIVVALLLAALVVMLVRPTPRPTGPRNFPRSFVAFVRYIANLIQDLTVSGIQMARLVLTPSLPIRPGIIAIAAETETDLGLTLSAHAVTLTPGELVVEIGDDHIMYTHALDATQAEEYVKAALALQRELLDDIFP
ncbi:MAG: Na+/H+ antiporter subunit E [Candidatus Promineofilum sp.]|nr:Na+/H+ antiporter subunit E [Promineifilum sp.]